MADETTRCSTWTGMRCFRPAGHSGHCWFDGVASRIPEASARTRKPASEVVEGLLDRLVEAGASFRSVQDLSVVRRVLVEFITITPIAPDASDFALLRDVAQACEGHGWVEFADKLDAFASRIAGSVASSDPARTGGADEGAASAVPSEDSRADTRRLAAALTEVLAEVEWRMRSGERYEYATGSEPIGIRGGVVISRRGDLCDVHNAVTRIVNRVRPLIDAAMASPESPDKPHTWWDNVVAAWRCSHCPARSVLGPHNILHDDGCPNCPTGQTEGGIRGS